MNARKHRRVFFYVVPMAAPLVFLAVLEGLFRIFGVGTPSLATDPARGFLPFNILFEEPGKIGGRRELVVKTPPVELPFMNLRQFNP